MANQLTIAGIQGAATDTDGSLVLKCLLPDDTWADLRVMPSAHATWFAALHSVPAGINPKCGDGFPLQPSGCRAFVLQDADGFGLAFQVAPGLEVHMVFPPNALQALKTQIAKLDALNQQQPGRA